MTLEAFTNHRLLVPAIGENGQPAFPALSLSTLAEQLSSQSLRIPLVGRGPRRAEEQWRLVLPEHASRGPSSEALKLALAPLLTLRNAPEPLYFQHTEGLTVGEQVIAFQERYADLLLTDDMTLVLAGPLEDLPWSLQQQLGHSHSVGRLCFETEEDYEAYARKVVNSEEANVPGTSCPSLLCAPRMDEATQLTHDVIMNTVAERLRTNRRSRQLKTLFRREASVPAMVEGLEHLPERGLWVFGGHGRMPRDWSAELLGAPVDQSCLDFHIGRLEGMERCLDRGIAVLVTCFGAGRRGGWQVEPLFGGSEANRPGVELLSPLPTALLRHPRGPLAVVGHVDEVYLLGFGDRERKLPTLERQPGVKPLLGLLSSLVGGQRLSKALHPFRTILRLRGQSLMETLIHQHGKQWVADSPDWRLLSSEWLVYQDAVSWVVLGDPYARLTPTPTE